jgi:hypothetical protein
MPPDTFAFVGVVLLTAAFFAFGFLIIAAFVCPCFVFSNSESIVGVGVLFSCVTFLRLPRIFSSAVELCPVQYASFNATRL